MAGSHPTVSRTQAVLNLLAVSRQSAYIVFRFAGYNATDSSILPTSPTNSSSAPPAVAVNPQDTSGSGNNTVAGSPSSMSNRSRHLIPFIYTFMIILFPILAIV